MLKKIFTQISSKYCKDLNYISTLWQEIEKSHQNRAYHNLKHLETMYTELSLIKDQIDDFESIFYAICYHDIVYDINAKDNEAKSAILAGKRLHNLTFPKQQIRRTEQHILATKTHKKHHDQDSNFLLDADLSILASSNYQKYALAIRKEYESYDDKSYTEGRKKVLKYFLAQNIIYQSDIFYAKYEAKARVNLGGELRSLEE